MQDRILFFLILLSSILACPNQAWAQQDLGLHFMQGTWQARYTNPAFVPDHRVVLSLPGFYNHFRSPEFSYRDIVQTNAQGQAFLDLDAAIDGFAPRNVVQEQADLPTFGLGIAINKVYIELGHSFHFLSHVDFPKTLAQLAWQGNAVFIGETVELAPTFQLQAYHSTYLGLSSEVSEGIRIGGRMRYLSGIGDISSAGGRLRLTTDEEIYQSTLDANYTVNSTGALTYNGLTDVGFSINDGVFEVGQLFAENYGLAFDFGISYQLEKWGFHISALDLGNITWRRNPDNTQLNGSFEYGGLDILEDVLLEDVTKISIADSLDAIYEVQSSEGEYSTSIPRKYYLSTTYQTNEWLQVGALMYFEGFKGEVYTSFALSGNAQVSHFFSAGLLYAYTPEVPFKVGLNSAIRLGPLQAVFATDNLFTAFNPEDSKGSNFRLGINLVFAQLKNQKPGKTKLDERDFFR